MKSLAVLIAAFSENMLEAKKSAWFEKIFAVYNRNLLKRRFESLRIFGLDSLQEKKPSVIYANHSSWWDGLVAFQISHTLKADAFVMMEEKHLQKLFLFRRLGAFSVVRENSRRAAESLNYAVNLLQKKTTRTLWIFPQGEIVPSDARPLKFYNGLSRIVEKSESCAVVSLAMRYEFLGDYKPEILVRVGAAEVFNSHEAFDKKHLTEIFEKNLTNTLDELKQDIASKNTARYENIL